MQETWYLLLWERGGKSSVAGGVSVTVVARASLLQQCVRAGLDAAVLCRAMTKSTYPGTEPRLSSASRRVSIVCELLRPISDAPFNRTRRSFSRNRPS